VRYYWVIAKGVLTLTALTALVFVLRARIALAAATALQLSSAELATSGIGRIGIVVTAGPFAALLMLLVIAVIAVYKPWGQTPFGNLRRAGVAATPSASSNLDVSKF
jgi:hypothetical protein